MGGGGGGGINRKKFNQEGKGMNQTKLWAILGSKQTKMKANM